MRTHAEAIPPGREHSSVPGIPAGMTGRAITSALATAQLHHVEHIGEILFIVAVIGLIGLIAYWIASSTPHVGRFRHAIRATGWAILLGLTLALGAGAYAVILASSLRT